MLDKVYVECKVKLYRNYTTTRKGYVDTANVLLQI